MDNYALYMWDTEGEVWYGGVFWIENEDEFVDNIKDQLTEDGEIKQDYAKIETYKFYKLVPGIELWNEDNKLVRKE